MSTEALSLISFSAGQYFSCWNVWSKCSPCLAQIKFQSTGLTSFSLWGNKKRVLARSRSTELKVLFILFYFIFIVFYFIQTLCRELFSFWHLNVFFFLFKTHIKPSLISFLVLLFCRGLRLKTFLPLGADHSTKRSWIDGAFLSSLADWLLLAGHDLSLLLFFVGQTNQPPQVPQYYLSLLC